MVKEFIVIIVEAVYAFYDKCDVKEDMEILKEDIQKYVTSLIVKDQVYQIIMVMLRLQNIKLDKDIRKKLEKLSKVLPQDVGVDDYLLLNEESPINQLASRQNTRAKLNEDKTKTKEPDI